MTASATNATTIAIDGIARFGVPLLSSAAPIGFRDIATETNGFEIDKRLIAVIALISDDLLEAVTDRPHRLDLLGHFNQRLDARLRIAVISVLHGDADDRARLEIDCLLGLVRQVRPPVLHLRDLRVAIVPMRPVVIRHAPDRPRVGVSMPEA